MNKKSVSITSLLAGAAIGVGVYLYFKCTERKIEEVIDLDGEERKIIPVNCKYQWDEKTEKTVEVK